MKNKKKFKETTVNAFIKKTTVNALIKKYLQGKLSKACTTLLIEYRHRKNLYIYYNSFNFGWKSIFVWYKCESKFKYFIYLKLFINLLIFYFLLESKRIMNKKILWKWGDYNFFNFKKLLQKRS